MKPAVRFYIGAIVVIACGVGMMIIFGPLLAMAGGYVIAAGAGLFIAHCISRPPELRTLRLSQLVLVPIGFMLCVYVSGFGGLGGFTCFLGVLGFLIVLLVPNIAYLFGMGLSNILDPQDWTPEEEEIALRPIRKLIDRDNYRQALGELDEILKNQKPTYEAVLTKAKLLHHIGRIDEAEAALHSLIGLSNSTPQQLAVMEMLAFLRQNQPNPPEPLPPASAPRRIEINHELVLYPTSGDDATPHKEIQPGAYEIESIIRNNRVWLKLKGQDWGNAESCWNAIVAATRPAAGAAKDTLFRRIARFNQSIGSVIKGKPRRQVMFEAKQLFREANDFIRRGDWAGALPLLEKASASDPDKYEFAYRWLQAVRQTSDDAATATVLDRVLEQSQWSASEEQMLKQLRKRS